MALTNAEKQRRYRERHPERGRSRSSNWQGKARGPFICLGCGRSYWTKRAKGTGGEKYCSRECFFALMAKQKEGRLEEKRLKRGQKVRECRQCGSMFAYKTAHHRLCSDECRKKDACVRSRVRSVKNKVVRTVHCKECRKVFATEYGPKRRTFCSRHCGQRNVARIEKAVRRARRRRVPCESIDPLEVFQRDGWICMICGTRTLKRL